MKEISVDWVDLKAFVDARSLSIQYLDIGGAYHLKAMDGSFVLSLEMRQTSPASSDQTDFETNYKSLGNVSFSDSNGIPLQRYRAFANTDDLKFRGTGISGTATKNTTTNFDYELTENRFVNGVEFFLNNQEFGDTAKFQVIDIDNTLGYGANFVLDEFGTDWNFASDTQRQGPYIIPYPALVYSGLYIRIVYNSSGATNDVDFACNLFLHKKP